jgi:oligopeptide transport system substrate-binding protein
MAMYDGLVEYHPKTMDPIPAIAESWKISPDGTEFIFNLRKNAKFSNGEPIKAQDFVYTLRRALSPELAAQNAYLAYEIKYAQAYNGGESFVRDANGQFLLKKEFEESAKPAPAAPLPVSDASSVETAPVGQPAAPTTPTVFGADTEFHRFNHLRPNVLSVPSMKKDEPK